MAIFPTNFSPTCLLYCDFLYPGHQIVSNVAHWLGEGQEINNSHLLWVVFRRDHMRQSLHNQNFIWNNMLKSWSCALSLTWSLPKIPRTPRDTERAAGLGVFLPIFSLCFLNWVSSITPARPFPYIVSLNAVWRQRMTRTGTGDDDDNCSAKGLSLVIRGMAVAFCGLWTTIRSRHLPQSWPLYGIFHQNDWWCDWRTSPRLTSATVER